MYHYLKNENSLNQKPFDELLENFKEYLQGIANELRDIVNKPLNSI